ncbi:hypothetical protein [Cupriavidus pauculus]|uniref:Uncharacterized protein n=1 Tax=Cupriavidus pauculus TaxID=82633 RepID=A0A2N5C516_9BURK|nr:hypothetical protein [Cupriavidus pauculus]PLP97280.1 hypothetical protein CYJ10_28375 [Cupriavidus pauculus]
MARLPRLLSLAALVVPLYGCAGAPAVPLFGAYFPLWLLSALVGIAGALIAWRIFVTTGWAETIRWQLLVNTAIGLMIAEIVWLIGTGHFP